MTRARFLFHKLQVITFSLVPVKSRIVSPAPRETYVAILRPRTPERDHVWKQGLYRGAPVKAQSLGWPNSIMVGVLIRRALGAQRQTDGQTGQGVQTPGVSQVRPRPHGLHRKAPADTLSWDV